MDLTLFINNEHPADDDLTARFNDHIEQVRIARQAGYDGIAIGNHLSFGSTARFKPPGATKEQTAGNQPETPR